jgi:hypothetical protein
MKIAATARVALCLGSMSLLCAAARAQTTCGAPAGPDAVAGPITAPVNYAASGDVDALSMGSTVCNVGSMVLAYFASTNQHPLTAQNLYRFSNVDGATRFEQLGMSWVFHGVFALQTSTCCTSCQASDGLHLGARCSSPDTASRNGAQAGLGPRWQVNAFTGAFTFPAANPPFTGTVARRLQAHVADLELPGGPTGARYFVEHELIAPDDAASGNGTNNASHRELTVTSTASEWTFSLAPGSSTQTEAPAIRAWKDIDPNVALTNVQVPGEGLFVLAHEVTDLGGGTWHYEYALYNMNSDRSAGSFSIPIASGVHVSNVGFHDVDYHDGDGPGNVDFDGTDWATTLSGGSLTFATGDFATNPSANALRWGTLYNFRFDANVPPQAGLVTVGLFKPLGPGPLTAAASVPADGTPYLSDCFGDGSAGPCPCANSGTAGHGCQNSAATGGALLSASGVASFAFDTFQLTSSGELPSALSIVLQGSAAIAPANFGDGLRCAGGTLKRLRVENAVGGTLSYPDGAETPIHVQSATLGDAIPLGATRHYQVYYRDSSLGFCPDPPGSTFNVTGAVSVVWGS